MDAYDGMDFLNSLLNMSSDYFELSRMRKFVVVIAKNQDLRQYLLKVVCESKESNDNLVIRRASNAITLLNFARVSFSGMDF
mmetsp:Transcript_10632/g.9206  ORF Transcript_10632/g.9206 Transcript_10632/m.9206 type:complete len:82 (-) Transcript_10632:1472-1717(-)